MEWLNDLHEVIRNFLPSQFYLVSIFLTSALQLA